MPKQTDKEVWKDVKNYEGLYQVSNHGRVKRLEGLIYATYHHVVWEKEKQQEDMYGDIKRSLVYETGKQKKISKSQEIKS